MTTTSDELVPVLQPSKGIRCERISTLDADKASSAIVIIAKNIEELTEALTNPPPVSNPKHFIEGCIAHQEELLASVKKRLENLESEKESDRPANTYELNRS